MSDCELTERGWVEKKRIGDIEFRYRTGRDVSKDASVFDLCVGEVIYENVGQSTPLVEYAGSVAHFEGHSFELGPNQEYVWGFPRAEHLGSDDYMGARCTPGRKGLMTRHYYMRVVAEIGREHLLDGTMRTRFTTTVVIDGTPHVLEFGPHTFHVDLDRDWDAETERYMDLYAAHARGEIPL